LEKGNQARTLYPYLVDGAPLRLQFPLISEDSAILERMPFPFPVMSESDPFARLIGAEFRTAAGSLLKRVFLLIQRDQYLLPKTEWCAVNNLDVADSWQKAFSRQRTAGWEGAPILLPDQAESDGLALLEPLLFCKVYRSFFPPLCFKCGRPLELCLEDDLLVRLGLQPYSRSLKRYLFCPACGPDRLASFYVSEREGSDPPGLKDQGDLFGDFRLLLERNQPARFPCRGCIRRQECYGPDLRVSARLVPFSFFPFYLLIFHASSLHALDLLPLLGGASFSELQAELKVKGEWGRLNGLESLKQDRLPTAPFFFDGEQKGFLEVLHLKLSFLNELFRIIGRDRRPDAPDGHPLPIDRIWADVPDPGGLVPFFWNFKMRSVGVVGILMEDQILPPPGAASVLYFMTLAWFYALLVNKTLDKSAVRLALSRMLEQAASEKEVSSGSLEEEERGTVLSPRNIFWDPGRRREITTGRDLWQRTLDLGTILLGATYERCPDWSWEGFSNQLRDLTKEVRDRLFESQPAESPRTGSSIHEEEDMAIRAILSRISEKWKRQAETAARELKETVSISAGHREEELSETILLFPAAGAEECVSIPTSGPSASELKETVVLKPDAGADPGILESTVLFPSEEEKTSPQASPETRSWSGEEASPGADFLTETVILGPGVSRAAGPDLKPAAGEASGKREQIEVQGLSPRREPPPGEEDFLAETIVQPPRERVDRRQDKKR
jgi:hypothetical protein